MNAYKSVAGAVILMLLGGGPAAAAGNNRINRIVLHNEEPGTVVEIQGEHSPSFTTFKQNRPQQVVVDVAGATLGGVPASIPGDGKLISGITARQMGVSGSVISRVSIRLLKEVEYKVSIKGGSLFVRLTEGSGGVLASAGVPTWDENEADASAGQGRDLALADELSAPAGAKIPDTGDEPGLEEESSGGGHMDPPLVAAASVQPPPPPRGVVSGQIEAPSSSKWPEPGAEPKAPARAGQDGGRVPQVQTPTSGKPPLVAQAQETVEEVEEVEEVPVEVMEDNKQPDEETVPPPPPPPAESAEEAPPPPPPAAKEQKPAAVPPRPAERVEISSAIKSMTWVGFQQTQESSRVFVKTNAPVRYRLYEEGDKLVVLELENTRIPVRNNRRFLDTHFFDSAVTMITPREIEGASASVRIEIELRNRVPFRAAQEENMLYVSFERPK